MRIISIPTESRIYAEYVRRKLTYTIILALCVKKISIKSRLKPLENAGFRQSAVVWRLICR